MTTTRGTARERARRELIRDVKELALEQLATKGAGELSLRAIARDLGMVSSALYRYFASREALLTALIVDAYSDLADALEQEVAAGSGDVRERWFGACSAMRRWALAQPHRFALVYGSPVPGYRAPADTIEPAGRVLTALVSAVDAASEAGLYADRSFEELDPTLLEQLAVTGQVLAPHVPAPVLARLVGAFGQLVGMINLELGGHFVGGFEPADRVFEHAVARSADALLLPGPGSSG
jgi:AcrR family transcriptional regulator